MRCFVLALFFACVASQCLKNTKCAVNGTCAKCTHTCEPGPACCGNGVCETHESCSTCPEDCGTCPSCDNACGNGLCDLNESGCNCPQDCGPCCCDGVCSGLETFTLCPNECGGALHLRTIDRETGEPVATAQVVCTSSNQVTTVINQFTDSKGDLVVGFLEPNSYTCTARANGYAANSASHVVLPGGKVYIPTIIPMIKADFGTISGVVRHGLSRGFLRGVVVTCSTATRSEDTTTSARGSYTLKALRDGTYTCNAFLSGYAPSTASIVISRGVNAVVDFSLAPLPASFSLTIVDKVTSRPVNNVTVSCGECLSGRSLGSQVSSANGQVAFSGIVAERGANVFSCTLSAPSYWSRVHQVELQRGKTSSLTTWLAKA